MMMDWQDWLVGFVVLGCAVYMVREFYKPFVAQGCSSCAGDCKEEPKPNALLHIEM